MCGLLLKPPKGMKEARFPELPPLPDLPKVMDCYESGYNSMRGPIWQD
jgi:hypothetical protein